VELRVRRAVEADASRLAAAVFPNFDPDDVKDNFLCCLKDDRVNVFVAEAAADGPAAEIVGQVQVDLAGPPRTHVMRIYSMVVAEPWRRQGIGRKMMEFVETWARGEGVELALLEVYPDNLPALDFYTGLGFERYGFLHRGSKFSDRDYRDEILLRKWLR
jgi:ribosomal protein S18 acetylase RimI-like enzyme